LLRARVLLQRTRLIYLRPIKLLRQGAVILFENRPNLCQPIKSPFRQTWRHRIIEILFEVVAKVTIAIAALIALVLIILAGESGGFFSICQPQGEGDLD
jgi:hypothetical protein